MAAARPPKVSEKTLELNVGAEILHFVRWHLGWPQAYLRGLTQKEERAEGVDHYVETGATAFLAFQFKAPKRSDEKEPYRFTLSREQHASLAALAALHADAVFYVFPFYLSPGKVLSDSPTLLRGTWFLRVADLPLATFGRRKTITIRCKANVASINPDFDLRSIGSALEPGFTGAPLKALAELRTEAAVTRRESRLRRGFRLLILGEARSKVPTGETQVHDHPTGGGTDDHADQGI